MKKYNLTCAYCGTPFESQRSDALTCSDSCRTMNSRDKKQKENLKGEYAIEYDVDENQQLMEKAKLVGMTTEEFIKFTSLHTIKDYSTLLSELKELKIANKELKAKLAFYTDDFEGGLFLDIEDQIILDIMDKMDQFGMHFPSVQEYIVYASLNMQQLITDSIKATVKELMMKKAHY